MEISQRSLELYKRLAHGWNTWDIDSVSAHVFMPDKVRINLSLFISHSSAYAQNLRWNEVERFGEHSIDGSYTCVYVRLKDAQCCIETASRERQLLIRVSPVKPKANFYVALSVQPIWNSRLTIGYSGNEIVAQSGQCQHAVRLLSERAEPVWDPVDAHHFVVDGNKTSYFAVNSACTKQEIDQEIEEAKRIWLSSTITGEGDMKEAIASMRRCLLWNTVYESIHGRVLSPVSRNWCGPNSLFGDYVMFGWDSFFAGMMMGMIDRDLAYANIFAILEEITEDGMVPNFGSGCGTSKDRSEPQVGSLCVWKLYLQYGDKWFIEECYPRLLSWNRWRFSKRDFRGDGMLELASTPWAYQPEDEVWSSQHVGARQGMMWESGIDNSPMWDRFEEDNDHHCMKLYYVGLNALMVMDCHILAKMARLLGKEDDWQELTAREERLGKLINENLWSDKDQCYMNKNWDDTFDSCMSLTNFYPLLAGIASTERLRSVVYGHLLNPKEFWGEYPVPNVSYTDPAFPDQVYWRGRVWAPSNFLIAEGLQRAGFLKEKEELAQKGLAMYLKCWKERGVVGENYSAVTGEAAEPGAVSDRFYHWGALLVYLAIEEKICFNPWTDDVVMHSENGWVGKIHNVPVGARTLVNI